MKDYKNVKDFVKAFLMAIGILSSPIVVFWLIVGVGMLYDSVFVHHDYDFRLCYGDGATSEDMPCIFLCKGDTTLMLRRSGKIKKTKGKYFNFHNSNGIVETKFVWSEDGFAAGYEVVPTYVADYKTDIEFMIVDQKPLDDILGKYQNYYDEELGHGVYGRPKDPHNLEIKYQMLDESPIHQFWIIALRTADVYGPLSYEEYIQKRIELGVAPELRLKCEKSLEE